jgi:peptidoglycan/LPS O-acetylase OafA/YrhL
MALGIARSPTGHGLTCASMEPAGQTSAPIVNSTEPIEDVDRGEADPPEQSPGGIDLPFRPDVEGLRAVAVLLVVLYHCGVSSGGYVGVDVFFVVSGFLITGLLLREHERSKKVSLPGFYARRARRILPAGMLVIIATILMAHHYENFISYGYLQQDGKWAALFAANIHYANVGTDYFLQSVDPIQGSALLHYWSLAVEEQFYFVWPTVVLLVGLLARWWPLRRLVFIVAAVGVVASFLWSNHEVQVNSIWAYYSPLTRAWELGLGALAATLTIPLARLNRWVGVALAWGGLAAICVSASIYTNQTVFPGTAALLPVLGTVAVIVGGMSGIGGGHLLGLPPARAVGRVSYGWYLLHYPPMILLIGNLYIPGRQLSIHERLWIAAITLAIAFGMYYVLEKPIRRSKALAARPWASLALGAAFVLAAFLVCSLYHKGLYG